MRIKNLIYFVFCIILMYLFLCGCNTNKESATVQSEKEISETVTVINEIDDKHIEEKSKMENYIKPIKVKICTHGGMFLLENGDLYTFGSQNNMPLGRGNENYQPSKILEGIVDIALGETMAVAIDTNGDLWGWCAADDDSWDEYELEPFPRIIANNVKSASVGEWEDVIAIIKEDKSLWLWGNTKVACKSKEGFTRILENVNCVSVSDDSCGVAILDDNSLWVWGEMLALGIETDIPVCYSENIKAVACNHSLAYIDQEDYLTVFSVSEREEIVNVGTIPNVQKIDLGYSNGLYLLKNGELYSWGDSNEYGQFGIGTPSWEDGGTSKIEMSESAKILEKVIDFDMTEYTAIALNSDGDIFVWGQNMNNILGIDDNNDVIAIPTILYSPISVYEQ